MKNIKLSTILPVATAIIVFIAIIAYGMNKIKPSDAALSTMKKLDSKVINTTTLIKVEAQDKTIGAAIIYPDEKMSPESYILLANKLSKANITTFIIKYPLGLSFFERNAGMEIISDNGSVSNWVVIAHGNGGPKAGYLADSKNPNVKGLVLMSSEIGDFSLTDDDLKVVNIRGELDSLSKDKEDIILSKLPLDTKTIVLEKGHFSKFVSTGHGYDEMSSYQIDIVAEEATTIINTALINTSKNRR